MWGWEVHKLILSLIQLQKHSLFDWKSMGGFLVNLKAISGPATNLLFLTNSTTGTQGPPMGENRVTSASKAYFFQYG